MEDLVAIHFYWVVSLLIIKVADEADSTDVFSLAHQPIDYGWFYEQFKGSPFQRWVEVATLAIVLVIVTPLSMYARFNILPYRLIKKAYKSGIVQTVLSKLFLKGETR